MNTVRLNITIPEDLANQLEEIVPFRKKSKFIADAIKKRLNELKDIELKRQLEEGYKARKGESKDIVKEFEVADLESWDEY